MTDGRSRRAFLTGAWRDALAAAPKVTSVVLPGVPLPAPSGGQTGEPADTITAADRRATLASPVQDTVTVDGLLGMADEFGLPTRHEALRALARPSVRLVPGAAGAAGAAGGRSCCGPALIQIDLAELTSLGVGSGLPAGGLLRFECDITDEGTRWRSAHDAGVRVTHILDRDGDAVESPAANHLQPSVELTLPRVWAAPVQALDLDESEQQGWQALRRWLAGRQGVELFDDAYGLLVVDRLFGYPDESRGEMPLLCELLAANAEVDDHPLVHPLSRQLEPASGRWRLLLQISAAPGVVWPWSGRYERLYFWIDEHHLELGELGGVFAVAQ